MSPDDGRKWSDDCFCVFSKISKFLTGNCMYPSIVIWYKFCSCYIYRVSNRSSVLPQSQWCVWVSQAGLGHSLKMCKVEQAWLACVLVLLWHFLETPGSCTERGLEGWWELQGTCGSASAASATGAWDCLLASLPVLRRFCFFLEKMACVLCIEVGEGQWIPAGKPE